MCFPADHRAWLGLRYGIHEAIESADAIVVIDCGEYFDNQKLHNTDLV
jgi:hypothetical protein